jgi:hypothetical protein
VSGKNQYPSVLNWQSTDPRTTFNPSSQPANNGSTPSGVAGGTMSGTNTIYSNIIELSRMDNEGFVVNWTGTPAGVLTVFAANADGQTWPSLTFNPSLAQPSGSAGYYGLEINQFKFKYLMFQYVNASGSGVLTINAQSRDLN